MADLNWVRSGVRNRAERVAVVFFDFADWKSGKAMEKLGI